MSDQPLDQAVKSEKSSFPVSSGRQTYNLTELTAIVKALQSASSNSNSNSPGSRRNKKREKYVIEPPSTTPSEDMVIPISIKAFMDGIIIISSKFTAPFKLQIQEDAPVDYVTYHDVNIRNDSIVNVTIVGGPLRIDGADIVDGNSGSSWYVSLPEKTLTRLI